MKGSSSSTVSLFRVSHQIRGKIAAVKTHPFDQVKGGLQTARFFDRDHAFLANLVHRVGDDLADLGVAVGRDSGDLLHARVILDRTRHAFDRLDRLFHSRLDTALHLHRIESRREQLDSFGNDGAGQHGRRGGAVAGDIGGLLGDFAQQPRAHVLELILEFELPDHADAVLCDQWGAEAL